MREVIQMRGPTSAGRDDYVNNRRVYRDCALVSFGHLRPSRAELLTHMRERHDAAVEHIVHHPDGRPGATSCELCTFCGGWYSVQWCLLHYRIRRWPGNRICPHLQPVDNAYVCVCRYLHRNSDKKDRVFVVGMFQFRHRRTHGDDYRPRNRERPSVFHTFTYIRPECATRTGAQHRLGFTECTRGFCRCVLACEEERRKPRTHREKPVAEGYV